MSDKHASLYFIPFVHITGITNVKSVFSVRQNVCFYKDRDIFSPSRLSYIFNGVVLSLTHCAAWSHGNCPGAVWYMPCAWNRDYTPNALDGRSIKAGEGRRVLESRLSPDGDTQFNLNAYYLFWVSHTSCLVKQGDNFFSPRGLKSRYTVSLTVNTKWIPPALNLQRKILSVFQDER